MKENIGLLASTVGFILVLGAVGELDLGGEWWPTLLWGIVGTCCFGVGSMLLKK